MEYKHLPQVLTTKERNIKEQCKGRQQGEPTTSPHKLTSSANGEEENNNPKLENPMCIKPHTFLTSLKTKR